MVATLQGLVRFVRAIVAVLAAFTLALVVAVSLSAYLVVSGQSPPLLRGVASVFGQLLIGQRTDHLRVDVRLSPHEHRLAAVATLTVRSDTDARKRLYLLLNHGLRVHRVRVASGTNELPATAYRLWVLTIVEFGQPLTKDQPVEVTVEYEGTLRTSPLAAASVMNDSDVLLPGEALWYPTDAHSFFSAATTVTLPASLTVVHNGVQATRDERGALQRVRWESEGAIGGLSLVAGRYERSVRQHGERLYQLFLPADAHLDSTRLLDLIEGADEFLWARFGPSQFGRLSAVVSRALPSGFNDGSGLVGLPMSSLRAGDYGFGHLAHQIARNWWGVAVAPYRLPPASGSAWVIEGFAAASSLLATQARYGDSALTERLIGITFDPAVPRVLADVSWLDPSGADEGTLGKGAYVALMLRQVLGDPAYVAGVQRFLDRFRHRRITDRDLQQVLEETSGQRLEGFFAAWVRSAARADLVLDTTPGSELSVANRGDAPINAPLDVWLYRKELGTPEQHRLRVGERLATPSDFDFAVLDPALAWADAERENNRVPRRADPVWVAQASTGARARIVGGVFPWVRSTVSAELSDGTARHTWEFERGLRAAPRWSADGRRLLASYDDTGALEPQTIVLHADGTRQLVGRGSAPAFGPGTAIYMARNGRIIHRTSTQVESVVAQQSGKTLGQPQPSPDGSLVAYTAVDGNDLALYVRPMKTGAGALVGGWERDGFGYRWGPDSRRVYVRVAGSWDWQIWEVPLDATAQPLVRNAAAIGDFALAADGTRLAFSAAPELTYPNTRRQLFVLDLTNRAIQHIEVPNADVSALLWTDADTVLVTASTVSQPNTSMQPAARTLKLVHLPDAVITDCDR